MDVVNNNQNKLSFPCKHHNKHSAQYLYLNPSAEEILLCDQCLDHPRFRHQSLDNFQQMQVLLTADEKTILPKWPPLKNRNLLYEIQEYIEKKRYESQNYFDIIHKYFDDLQKTIVDHLQQIKKETLIKYDNLYNIEEELFAYYNQLSGKEEIKDILKDPESDFNLAESRLKEFMSERVEDQAKNEENLLRIYNSYTRYLNQLDAKNLTQFQDKITKTLFNISYFPLLQDQNEESLQMKNKKEESPQLNLLLQLIQNPFNHLTKEFETKLTDTLSSLSPWLDSLDITDALQKGKAPMNSDQLSDEQLFLINKLVNKMKQIGNKVYQLDQINPDIFPNTKIVSSFLFQRYYFQDFLELAQKLPIFEMYSQKMNFTQSLYANSQFHLYNEMKGQTRIFTKNKGVCGFYDNKIISTQFLRRHKTYSIIFQAYLGKYGYQFGLTSSGLYGPLDNDGLCIQLSQQFGDKFELKKGSAENLFQNNLFQLQINLSQSIFEISDYPKSHNIIGVPLQNKPQNILSSRPFQIGFSLCCFQSQLQINSIIE